MGSPIVNLNLDECPNCKSKNIDCLGTEEIDEFRVEDLICMNCSSQWDQSVNMNTNEFCNGSYINYPEEQDEEVKEEEEQSTNTE
mgnify:FL=1|jgi:hypothetical protein